jgi:hypothetical protein
VDYMLTDFQKIADPKELKTYWEFVSERHLVWYRRHVLNLSQPWTKNPILQKYKFTNIKRENDRGSLWCINNIIKAGTTKTKLGRIKMFWEIFCYRMINFYETFEDVGLPAHSPFPAKEWEVKLRARKEAGFRVFTNAHITCQSNFKADRIANCIEMFTRFDNNLENIYLQVRRAQTFKEVYETLKRQYGIGPFISYQICIDLIYAGLIPFSRDVWSPIERGCERGLKIIFPTLKSKADLLEAMRWLWHNQSDYLDKYAEKDYLKKYNNGELFVLSDIENSCCEWSKYHSVLYNYGKARMHFKPTVEV